MIDGTSKKIEFSVPKKWLWNESPQLSFTEWLMFDISFISTIVKNESNISTVTCRALWLYYGKQAANSAIQYVYGNRNYGAYNFGDLVSNDKGWQNQNQRYITFISEPTGELLEYLWANAIPIE